MCALSSGRQPLLPSVPLSPHHPSTVSACPPLSSRPFCTPREERTELFHSGPWCSCPSLHKGRLLSAWLSSCSRALGFLSPRVLTRAHAPSHTQPPSSPVQLPLVHPPPPACWCDSAVSPSALEYVLLQQQGSWRSGPPLGPTAPRRTWGGPGILGRPPTATYTSATLGFQPNW